MRRTLLVDVLCVLPSAKIGKKDGQETYNKFIFHLKRITIPQLSRDCIDPCFDSALRLGGLLPELPPEDIPVSICVNTNNQDE